MRLFLLLFVFLCACVSPQDTLAGYGTEIRLSEAAPGGPMRVDPCTVIDPDPGFILAPERILWADQCTAAITNVDGCWVSLAADVIDVPELDIWCDFDCGGEGIEVSRVLADYPAFNEDPVRHTLPNPCPGVVE